MEGVEDGLKYRGLRRWKQRNSTATNGCQIGPEFDDALRTDPDA